MSGTVEIVSLLNAGNALEAIGVYFQLVNGIMNEAIHAVETINSIVMGVASSGSSDLGGPPPAGQRIPRRPYPSAGSGAAETVPPAAEVLGADAGSPGSAMWLPDAGQ